MLTKSFVVMAGLDPAIHFSGAPRGAEGDVDHRVEPGDDSVQGLA